MPALDREVLENWARSRLLKVELVQSLPRRMQLAMLEALVDAYTVGFQAAVNEITSEGASNAKRSHEG